MKNPRIYIGLLALATVVLVTTGCGKGKQKVTPTATPKATASASISPLVGKVVTFTGDTVNPGTVTISVGQSVTFVNQGSEKAELDSNPHPIHTSFGPLNNHQIGPGKSFTFTFTKAGKYGYHDHLHHSAQGTIIVK